LVAVVRGAATIGFEPREARLDIDTVIEEVLVIARGELQQHRVALHTEVDADLPLVLGDRMRLHSMFTTKEGGMGMGLSISRSIIAAHGGRIWASPGESVDSIFRISLPSKRGVEMDQIR
jgi:signal transduction histidine kinase